MATVGRGANTDILRELRAVLDRGFQFTFWKRFAWTGYTVTENPQEFKLHRMTFTDKSTVGDLWVDGKIFCHSLEPTCRKLGPNNKGAIPAGRYRILITYSNKFGKPMPELLDVPGFEGIRLHTGNIPADTEGCLILGDTAGVDYVGQSRIAFNRLMPIIKDRTDNKMLFISILGGRNA